jgi:hypothetical protein
VGYCTEHDKLIGGPTQVESRTESMAGWAHDFKARWRLQFDLQSGADNFATAGFTCSVADNVPFNPALYFANNSHHHV